MAHAPTVTAIVTVHVLDAAARAGVDTQAIAARLRLPTSPVYEDRITIAQLIETWEAAVRATRDPAFPLRVAAYPPRAERSLLTFYCASHLTIGETIDSMLRYWPTVTDAYRLAVEWQRDRFSLIFESAGFDERPGWRWHQEHEVADVVGIGLRVSKGSVRPESVTFRHPASASPADYLRAFGVMPVFNQERTALTYPRSILDEPVHGTPVEAGRLIKERLDALLDEAERGASAAGRVRAVIPGLLRARSATAPAAAHALGMGRRTLERRLDAEGTSFRALLDEARLSLARSWLDEVEIAEVADRLNYADVRAFDRAFRRWTGTTPSAWRLERTKAEKGAERPAGTSATGRAARGAPARGRSAGGRSAGGR